MVWVNSTWHGRRGSLENRICSRTPSFCAHVRQVCGGCLEPATESRLRRQELDWSLNADWVKGRYIRDGQLFCKNGHIPVSCAERASWRSENSNDSRLQLSRITNYTHNFINFPFEKNSFNRTLSNALYFHLSNLFNEGSLIRDLYLVPDGK